MPLPPPAGFEDIQQAEMSRLFGRIAGARVAALPMIALVLACLLVTEHQPWRRWTLVLGALLLAGFFLFEASRYRRRGYYRLAIPINISCAVLLQMGICAVTGGLGSPLIYVSVVLTFVGGLAIGPPISRYLVAFQLAGLWAMAFVETRGIAASLNLDAFGGGPRGGWNDTHLWASTAVLGLALIVAAAVGRRVRTAFDGMIRRALAAQEELLRAHADRAQELAALAGELAHELKNPLASIKGLAGLLAQNLPEGKGAERLGVLRHEIDRMQGILEESLNFSRPLGPLALQAVDLATLGREVAALHEGMAHERGVGLVTSPAQTLAYCDLRKVKQILLNLVQNALEASPPGGEVRIEALAAPDGGALVRVLDRGHGIDAAVAGKVFDAGVTTRARGSGLGLTVARAIARQHGGDLDLSEREGGGCSAVLHLPRAGEGA